MKVRKMGKLMRLMVIIAGVVGLITTEVTMPRVVYAGVLSEEAGFTRISVESHKESHESGVHREHVSLLIDLSDDDNPIAVFDASLFRVSVGEGYQYIIRQSGDGAGYGGFTRDLPNLGNPHLEVYFTVGHYDRWVHSSTWVGAPTSEAGTATFAALRIWYDVETGSRVLGIAVTLMTPSGRYIQWFPDSSSLSIQ